MNKCQYYYKPIFIAALKIIIVAIIQICFSFSYNFNVMRVQNIYLRKAGNYVTKQLNKKQRLFNFLKTISLSVKTNWIA